MTPSRPLPYPVIYVGSESGAPPAVKAYDAETGLLNFERTAYESAFTGGVRVATADFNADGFPDLMVAPGEGGGPRVRILNAKTGTQIDGPLGNFWAFAPSFTGGVELAAADVTGDGFADAIVAAGKGGGPHVRVFDGKTGEVVRNFFAFDPDFRGGVSIAAADFTGDGKADLIVGAGPGGGPHVKIFNMATGNVLAGPLGNFFAYDESFRGGVHVGTDWKTGDVTGDGFADLITGPGPGHAPTVKVYNGLTGQLDRSFAAFDASMTAGVRVASAYVTDDAYGDVIVATGKGVPNEVRVFDSTTNQQLPGSTGTYTPFGPTSTRGLTLAASNDPPNQYGFYSIPVSEEFPTPGPLTPVGAYKISQSVIYTDSDTKLLWSVTVTNTAYDSIYSTGSLGDIGLGFFKLNTNVISGVTIVPNEYDRDWVGSVDPSGSGSESGYISWEFDTEPIYVGELVTLTFKTPIVAPQGGSSYAATYEDVYENVPLPPQSTSVLECAIPGEPEIESVVWKTNNSILGIEILDENPNPGGGKRAYPEKRLPQLDSIARTQINIKVRLKDPVPNVNVFLKVFDVDDPNANTGSANNTNNTLDNEANGSDNRQTNSTIGVVLPAKLTDMNGEAVFTVTLSRAPGDNFRAVASTNNNRFAVINAKQNDGILSGIYDNHLVAIPTANSPIVISELLTVWRTLHLERDHMGSPPNGSIFRGKNNYAVPGGPNQIGDDDVHDGGSLPDAPIELLRESMLPAYISVKDDLGTLQSGHNFNTTIEFPFAHNISAEFLFTDYGRHTQNVLSSPSFWSVQILTVYEASDSLSNDPPGSLHPIFNTPIGTLLGMTTSPAGGQNPVYVFFETVRDSRAHMIATGNSDVVPLQLLYDRIVYHEVIHRFNGDHNDAGDAGDGAIMIYDNVFYGDDSQNVLNEVLLVKARSITNP